MRNVFTRQRLLSHAMVAVATATLVSCATTSTQFGSVSGSRLVEEAERQKQYVLETERKQQRRLDSLGTPLLREAKDFCTRHMGFRTGLRVSTLASYQKEWRGAATGTGISDTLTVTSLVPAGPAAVAGLAVGDRVLAVNGTALSPGVSGLKTWASFTQQVLAPKAPNGGKLPAAADSGFVAPRLSLRVRRAGAERVIDIPSERLCRYDLVVLRDDAVNAFADGSAIYVTTAMMSFAQDAELQTVVAHEIAHNAMGHIEAKQRNAGIGALFGALLDVAVATQGVNTGGKYTNEFAALGAMSFSQDFEREADYVGLYVLARGNHPIADTPNLWRRMATLSPGAIKFASSHPTTTERYVRLDEWVKEIDAKRATGQPLMPEMKKK